MQSESGMMKKPENKRWKKPVKTVLIVLAVLALSAAVWFVCYFAIIAWMILKLLFNLPWLLRALE